MYTGNVGKSAPGNNDKYQFCHGACANFYGLDKIMFLLTAGMFLLKIFHQWDIHAGISSSPHIHAMLSGCTWFHCLA